MDQNLRSISKNISIEYLKVIGLEHDGPPLLAKRAATRSGEFVALESLQKVNFLMAILMSCLSLERIYLESLQTIKYLMTISIGGEQSIRSSFLTGGEKIYLKSLQKTNCLMTISIGGEQSICYSILTGGATMATGCAGRAGSLRKEKLKVLVDNTFVQLILTLLVLVLVLN